MSESLESMQRRLRGLEDKLRAGDERLRRIRTKTLQILTLLDCIQEEESEAATPGTIVIQILHHRTGLGMVGVPVRPRFIVNPTDPDADEFGPTYYTDSDGFIHGNVEQDQTRFEGGIVWDVFCIFPFKLMGSAANPPQDIPVAFHPRQDWYTLAAQDDLLQDGSTNTYELTNVDRAFYDTSVSDWPIYFRITTPAGVIMGTPNDLPLLTASDFTDLGVSTSSHGNGFGPAAMATTSVTKTGHGSAPAGFVDADGNTGTQMYRSDINQGTGATSVTFTVYAVLEPDGTLSLFTRATDIAKHWGNVPNQGTTLFVPIGTPPSPPWYCFATHQAVGVYGAYGGDTSPHDIDMSSTQPTSYISGFPDGNWTVQNTGGYPY